VSGAVEIVLGGVFAGAAFALVALGFALVFRVMGVLNLSQGAFVVIGALTLQSLEVRFRWPLWLAFPASLVIAVAVGAVVERVAIRPGRRRLSTGGLLIMTAGLLTVFEGAALLIWGSQPYAIPTFSGERPVAIGGVHVPTQDLWIALATGLILLGFWLVLTRTAFGKALRACAENPAAASLMGIRVERMSLISFSAGAGIGAVGGMVLGPTISVAFDGGRYFTNAGFIAAVIGGMDSFPGAVVGGIGLGVVQQLGAGYVSSIFASTVVFVILLGVLVLRPSGILGHTTGRQDVAVHSQRLPSPLHVRGRPAWAAVAGLALVVALLPLIPGMSGYLETVVITGISFIAVLGLDLLMGYAGQVSLGHAGFMATGAYTAAILVTRYQVQPVLGVVAGILVSLVVALVLSLATARLRGLYMALATLAFGLLIDSVAVGATGLTGGPSGLVGIPALSAGPLSFQDPVANYYLVWGVAAVLFLVATGLMRSAYGRGLRAIRADQTAAAALGIPTAWLKTSALLLSAGFASIAGSLYAFDFHYLSPDMVSSPHSLEMVTMLMVGGQSSLLGPLLGSALVTVLPSVSQPLASAKTLAEGLLLVGILLYAPRGLIGLVPAARGLWRGARTR
jgi:branched-chain amino acid transport system permease protein